MSSSDLQVVVDQMPADPVKPSPSKLPKWLQSNRNKALTGLGLLTLIAIPAIVAPVVVSQQKKQQQNALRSTDPSSEQYARDAMDQNEDPDDFVAVDSPRRPTTRFNATRYSGNTTRRGTRLKVPPRSWANANKTRASLTRPERWTPFVKIRDGQVRGAVDWMPHVCVHTSVTCTAGTCSDTAVEALWRASSSENNTNMTCLLQKRTGVHKPGC